MPVEVILPKVDMDMATGRISRWFVAEGAAVKKGELLFEIETDKAAMEIDAPASGTLRNVVAAENVDIPVGQAVAWIYADGEAEAGAPASSPDGTESAESFTSPLWGGRAEGAGGGNLPANVATPTPALRAAPPHKGEGKSTAIRATPLARRLVRESGVALEQVSGSGPKGRVTRRDVEALAGASLPLEGRVAAKPPGGVVSARLDPENASSLAAATPPGPAGHPPLKGEGTANLHAQWLRTGGSSPAFVLLHGFGADLNSWRPMLAANAPAHPVLGIDLPGHGLSPRDIPANLDEIAAQVEAAISAQYSGPIVLVGHSLGGAIAATVAARAQADIRALLLIAPAGLGPEINGTFLDGFARAKSEASLVPWLKLLAADETVLSRPFINATLAQAADAGLRQAQSDMAQRFFADGTQTFDIRAMLAALDIPVRVIVGSADRIIPSSHAHGLPGTVAVHHFADTGHMPQLERRAEVMRILGEMARAVR